MRSIFLIISLIACVLGIRAQHGTFYDQRASLFEALPVDSTNIVFLGNSITNGCEWHELFGDARIINRGISGDIATGINDRLDPLLKGKPGKIFLMIGVNDVSHHIKCRLYSHRYHHCCRPDSRILPQHQTVPSSCLPFNESFKRWKNPRRQTTGNYRPQYTP